MTWTVWHAPATLTADRLADLEVHQLRSAGLSNQKATYILDSACKVRDKEDRLRNVGRMSDQDVIDELTKIKGIGVWTAQIFLMFSLGRLDVLPHDDLGLRTAIRDFYTLDDLPDKAVSEEIASAWRPYATVASWYCWQSLDKRRVEKGND